MKEEKQVKQKHSSQNKASNPLIGAVLSDCDYHEKAIQLMEDELTTLPAGSVHHRKIRGRSRFYYCEQKGKASNSKKPRYLRKEEEVLIHSLLRKKFVNESLRILSTNRKALERLIKTYQAYDPDVIMKNICGNYSIHSSDSKTAPAFPLKKKSENSWESEPFEQNKSYIDKLIYWTQNGLLVRSKSESIIAGLLDNSRIPFRYEAQLVLGEHVFYPDFTILKPQNKAIIYWEHFGLADDEEYEQSMNWKLKIYRDNGITQWDNLIVTFETKANPFNTQAIQRLIDAFLIS